MTDELIQDFSTPAEEKKKPIKFKIDGDIFEAVPEVGGALLMNITNTDEMKQFIGLDLDNLTQEDRLAMSVTINEQIARAVSFMDLVLLPESAQRFAERLRSTTEPISLGQAFRVWQWLIQKYGANPTGPSSPSANGHGGTGETSTATAPSTT